MTENEPRIHDEEPPPEDVAEFAADVSIRINELRRLIGESEPPLTESQREQIRQLIADHEQVYRDYVDEAIAEHRETVEHGGGSDYTPPTGLTEGQRSEVIELIGDHAPAGGGGEVGEDLRRRLEAMLARLDASLKELEKDLARVVGPSPNQLSSAYHSNPGWGIHFEAEYPVRFLQATVKANQSGHANFEAVRYDPVAREPQGVEDSALIGVPGAGEHEIELNIEIGEPGHYVLTRDFVDSPVDEDRIAMRRTDVGYPGWASDSGDGLTFHGGADAGGRWGGNDYWYYLGDLHVRDAIPDTGSGDEDADLPDGFGEGPYGDGPYGDGEDRPTFGN